MTTDTNVSETIHTNDIPNGPSELRRLVDDFLAWKSALETIETGVVALAAAWDADRAALAQAQLCRRLENGERNLGTGFAVGAARKFVADEMTARCADCGQMIMLTVQEYIKRRKDSPK